MTSDTLVYSTHTHTHSGNIHILPLCLTREQRPRDAANAVEGETVEPVVHAERLEQARREEDDERREEADEVRPHVRHEAARGRDPDEAADGAARRAYSGGVALEQSGAGEDDFKRVPGEHGDGGGVLRVNEGAGGEGVGGAGGARVKAEPSAAGGSGWARAIII